MTGLRSIYGRCREAVNYRLPVIAGARFAKHCRPTTVIFLLTHRCNARCVHCDIWKSNGPEENPSLEQLKSCLRELRGWLGAVEVTFSGGEALIKPYTPELLRYATSLGLRAELLTNGFWEDQSRIQQAALANPSRITVSFDGFGQMQDTIRGRAGFHAVTTSTIETLCSLRRQHALRTDILLKTVIMQQNLGELGDIARFAAEKGVQVRYQPIEQNYSSEDDSEWFLTSANWPRDAAKATAAVAELMKLKRHGLPIANSCDELKTFIRYLQEPRELRLSIQSHLPPDQPLLCSATMYLQIEPNGDVKTCARRAPVGNITTASIRQIWRSRPEYWRDCCLHQDSHEQRSS